MTKRNITPADERITLALDSLACIKEKLDRMAEQKTIGPRSARALVLRMNRQVDGVIDMLENGY